MARFARVVVPGLPYPITHRGSRGVRAGARSLCGGWRGDWRVRWLPRSGVPSLAILRKSRKKNSRDCSVNDQPVPETPAEREIAEEVLQRTSRNTEDSFWVRFDPVLWRIWGDALLDSRRKIPPHTGGPRSALQEASCPDSQNH